MKGLNRLFLCLFFLICANNLSAQSPATGCLRSDNVVYTNDYTLTFGPTNWYRTTSSNTLPINACSWKSSSGGGTCYTCSSVSGNFIFGYTCNSSQMGTLGTFMAVSCPIDDYITLLLLASGGAGFFILRMKNFKV